MHHLTELEFLHSIRGFLGGYYICLALMNGLVALYLWKELDRGRTALIWLGVSVFYIICAPLGMSGNPNIVVWITLPLVLRDGVDAMMNPTVYIMGSFVGLSILFAGRRYFTRPLVAWGMLNIALLLMGLSMTDSDFAAIVLKPDNVPIVAMVYLLGFFTWLSARKAVLNDNRFRQNPERVARGEEPLGPLELEDQEKVLVWPDLVYTELICMVALTALLLVWAIGLQAPLEEPASAVKTPNPSKAPWYFLGLQEMLVYYDPWMAGVVLPSAVIFGLMAVPYIDYNKEGNGYYTIDQRKFAYVIFQFGFLVLWVTLIVMGTFLRGPNWNFFGPYETWDAHKVEALNNVDLSQYFWIGMLGQGLPQAPAESGAFTQIFYILLRESPGLVLVVSYLALTPPMLVVVGGLVQNIRPEDKKNPVSRVLAYGLRSLGVFREHYRRMGFVRYMALANLFLLMSCLPIKMLLRWTINLKYFISIPEYFLNL
jgi:hypothetical protein